MFNIKATDKSFSGNELCAYKILKYNMRNIIGEKII